MRPKNTGLTILLVLSSNPENVGFSVLSGLFHWDPENAGLLWARDPEIPPMEASLFWRPLISTKPQKSSNGDNSICFILHSALGPHKSAIHINFPSGLSVPDKAKYGEKSDKCFARIALSSQTPENMTKKHYSRHSNNWKRKSTLPKAKPTNDVLLPKSIWRNWNTRGHCQKPGVKLPSNYMQAVF